MTQKNDKRSVTVPAPRKRSSTAGSESYESHAVLQPAGTSLLHHCPSCGAPTLPAINEHYGQGKQPEALALDVRGFPIYMVIIHDGFVSAKPLDGFLLHSIICTGSKDDFEKKT